MGERTEADIIYALHEEVVNLTERLATANNEINKLEDKIHRTMNLIEEEENARSAGMSAAYISSKDLRKALGYPKKEDEKNDETNS
jgi:predicted  nucleic acid-binding Zn-ribbon protein